MRSRVLNELVVLVWSPLSSDVSQRGWILTDRPAPKKLLPLAIELFREASLLTGQLACSCLKTTC